MAIYWVTHDLLPYTPTTETVTCISEVGGFYDVFGSSYLHHRGLGVSDDVFGSSSWADHKLKVNQNFILNVNKSIFRFWILTSRFPILKYSELHFKHSNFWVVLHIVLLKESNKINSSLLKAYLYAICGIYYRYTQSSNWNII